MAKIMLYVLTTPNEIQYNNSYIFKMLFNNKNKLTSEVTD